MNERRILIVGAGLCGTWLFQRLKDHAQVTVVEKSKGLGGRIASRRYPSAQGEKNVNHGGHRFLARDLEEHPWFTKLLESHSIEHSTVSHEYQFRGPATASFKQLWEPCRDLLKLNWKANKLERRGNFWAIQSDQGETLMADLVIFTSPVPQSLLLTRSLISTGEIQALDRVRYFKRILAVTPNFQVEAFSDAESEQLFELPEDQIRAQRPQAIDIKKWRYETLAQGMMGKHRYLKSETTGLWFAGDAFVGYSRPETWGIPTALLSADAVADEILKS